MGQSVNQLNFLTPIDLQINRTVGNTQLVNYGIQTEQSDYRAHVGYKTQHLFVFSTASAKQVLQKEQRRYELKNVNSRDMRGNDICTAKGFPVPLSDIPSLQEIMIPPDVYKKHPIILSDPTTIKGVQAVSIVVEMLKRHLILLPIEVHEVTEKTLQIQGQDILVKANLRIQVKCDFSAGRKPEGSGNLFLQIAECNPFRRF